MLARKNGNENPIWSWNDSTQTAPPPRLFGKGGTYHFLLSHTDPCLLPDSDKNLYPILPELNTLTRGLCPWKFIWNLPTQCRKWSMLKWMWFKVKHQLSNSILIPTQPYLFLKNFIYWWCNSYLTSIILVIIKFQSKITAEVQAE